MVSIDVSSTQITRGEPVDFTATVSDDRDSPNQLVIEWAEFESENQGCDWIGKEAWATPRKGPVRRASDTPYEFVAESMEIVCLCVRATDDDGASGQACQRIEPANFEPKAVITDVSGKASGVPRPLCSQVHLSAEKSQYPAGDQIDLNWTIAYSGAGAGGMSVTLADCEGVTASLPGLHRCFYAVCPGTYTVRLSITDTPTTGNTADVATSPEVSFVVPVDADTPPCLRQTDPEANRQLVLLSRSPDLGATYQSRTFKVLSAADDCEPYPVPAGSSKQPTQFVWSVYDTTRPPLAWVYQANTTNAFTVSQAMFPGALPGDTVKVRVEVRDAAVQQSYLGGFAACASEEIDICCGADACTGGEDDCIRWTTWTVQFQP
ncbi:MAG: hypothetical protein JXP73_05285 [Deltaproteobacteria bacterium]|nr:hypothetical protein [Deltaproteobacteria bacterium]